MPDPLTLPFSQPRQRAALHYFLTDRAFSARVQPFLKPSWFNSPVDGKLCKYAFAFHKKFQRMPSRSELTEFITGEPQDEVRALARGLEAAETAAKEVGVDIVQAELLDWYRARVYREGSAATDAAYNDARFEEAWRLQEKLSRDLRSLTFGNSLDFDFSDLVPTLVEADDDYASALTTGLTALDDALLPRSRRGKGHGALQPGRTTVLVAPSMVGKTTTLITTMVANIKAGRSILYLTHEGTPKTLVRKMCCCFLGVDDWTLGCMLRTPEGKAQIEEFAAVLQRQVVFGPDVGTTIEAVEAYVEWKQEERVAETGKGFDLLVDDYPAILGAEHARGGKDAARREVDETTYRAIVKLARDHNFHALLAVQTNRLGSKKNRSQEEVVSVEDIAESFGIVMAADNIITLNRPPSDGTRMKFFVAKCREGEAETFVLARSNFSTGTSHSNNLGATYTWRNVPLTEQVDRLIEQYNGKALPDAVADALMPDEKAKKTSSKPREAAEHGHAGRGFGTPKHGNAVNEPMPNRTKASA